MSKKLISAHEPAVDAANAANLLDYLTYIGGESWVAASHGTAPVAEVVPSPSFVLIHSFDTEAFRDDLAEAVCRALAHSSRPECSTMWAVFPALDPGSSRLEACLAETGMQCIADTPGMAIDLRSLERKGIPSGLTIERVGDSETMRTWVEIQAASGGMPERSRDARLHWASHRGFDQDGKHQAYLARFCGQPVGCSLLHVWAGVAGVYQVATLPEARRRGIGRAMTMHALLEGKARGCDVGVLHAREAGRGLFREMGFVERPPVRLFLTRAAV